MSAGQFDNVRYECDNGVLVKIRIQPETATASFGGAINSSPPGGAAAGYPSAVVSKSRRGIGIHPRLVTVKFAAADTPTGYKPGQLYRIPCLNQLAFASAAETGAGNYLGKTCEIVSKTKEVIK